MSTRDIGKSLEYFVSETLNEIFKDENIRPTKNSGASTELADIKCSHFLIECKKRLTKNITIDEKVWDKLVSELPLKTKRIPLYILENKNKKQWVVLDFKDFCKLLKEL